MAGIGYRGTQVATAVVVAVVVAVLPPIGQVVTLPVSWQLCFLYGVVSGAFSNCLPTYLGNVYGRYATAAGTRTAGSALGAVVVRPVGGILADRFGPRPITITCLAGTAVPAVVVAFQPGQERVDGAAFLVLALFLGLGTGGGFGWVGRAAPARDVGTVGGSSPRPAGSGDASRPWSWARPTTRRAAPTSWGSACSPGSPWCPSCWP
ncbi:MFS transporter [Kocuria sp. M1R5S2]|uniref:MFS transporter n=1 Tax=Kocuria rhizosphaerae TaxID=3376285 RepID=UPI0037B79DF8